MVTIVDVRAQVTVEDTWCTLANRSDDTLEELPAAVEGSISPPKSSQGAATP